MTNGQLYILKNVLLCTGLNLNVLSPRRISGGDMGTIDDHGKATFYGLDTFYSIFSTDKGSILQEPSAETVILALYDATVGAYSAQICHVPMTVASDPKLPMDLVAMRAIVSNSKLLEEISIWHKRLGHVGLSSLEKIARGNDSLPKQLQTAGKAWKDVSCRPCAIGQRHRGSFARSDKRAKAPLDVVHIDLSGQHNTVSTNGNQYFMVFLDDNTRYVWVYFLKNRTAEHLTAAINKFLGVHGPNGETVKKLHGDNEFNCSWFHDLCIKNHIAYSFIQPHTPQHNSRAEQMMATLKAPARAMLGASGLPLAFWEYAIANAAFIRNRLPHKSINNVSPWELWHGRPPNLRYLRTFGCVCYPFYVKKNREQDGQNEAYDPRARMGIFLGYSPLNLCYTVYLPHEGKFVDSSHVVFDESTFWSFGTQQIMEHRRGWQAYDLWPEDDFERTNRFIDPLSADELREKDERNLKSLTDDECVKLAEESSKAFEAEVEIEKELHKSQGEAILEKKRKEEEAREEEKQEQEREQEQEQAAREEDMNKQREEIEKKLQEEEIDGDDDDSLDIPSPVSKPTTPPPRERTPLVSDISTKFGNGENQRDEVEEMLEEEIAGDDVVDVGTSENINDGGDEDGDVSHETGKEEEEIEEEGDEATQGSETIEGLVEKETDIVPKPTNGIEAEKGKVEQESGRRVRRKAAAECLVNMQKKNMERRWGAPQRNTTAKCVRFEPDASPETEELYNLCSLVEAIENASHLSYFDSYHSTRSFQIRQPATRATIDGAPSSMTEVRRRPDWPLYKKAMDDEWNSLWEMGTFEVCDQLPEGKNLVGCKWVLTQKYDINGKVIKIKGRLCCQGYTQIQGVDVEFTFSPVIKLTALRMLLAAAVMRGLRIKLMDVKSAYLNGVNEHEIYMPVPIDYRHLFSPNAVLKVIKSLYGLKASGREWFKTLKTRLEALEFRQSLFEDCVFIHKQNKALLLTYVDNLVLLSPSKEIEDKIAMMLRAEFTMTDSPPDVAFLGIALEQLQDDRKGIALSQRHYIKTILKRFDLSDAKALKRPLDKNVQIHAAASNYVSEPDDRTDYMAKIGSLLWVSQVSRPDIAHSVSLMARFASNPSKRHHDHVDDIFRYLKYTIGHSLILEAPSGCTTDTPLELMAYSDADYGGDRVKGKSTTGYVILLNNMVVDWKSQLQSTVALSTTDAEMIALSETARRCIGLQNLLNDVFEGVDTKPINILTDSATAMSLTQEFSNHDKIKHLRQKEHAIRAFVKDNDIAIQKIRSVENLADPLTKSMDAASATKFRDDIGIQRTA